jgi:hypothetical protein
MLRLPRVCVNGLVKKDRSLPRGLKIKDRSYCGASDVTLAKKRAAQLRKLLKQSVLPPSPLFHH